MVCVQWLRLSGEACSGFYRTDRGREKGKSEKRKSPYPGVHGVPFSVGDGRQGACSGRVFQRRKLYRAALANAPASVALQGVRKITAAAGLQFQIGFKSIIFNKINHDDVKLINCSKTAQLDGACPASRSSVTGAVDEL